MVSTQQQSGGGFAKLQIANGPHLIFSPSNTEVDGHVSTDFDRFRQLV
jgi:hypothetical protein